MAGVAAWWLFFNGGIAQIQGMLGSISSGSSNFISQEQVSNGSSVFQRSNINGNVSVNRKVNTGGGSDINQNHSIVQVNGRTISESNLGRMMSI